MFSISFQNQLGYPVAKKMKLTFNFLLALIFLIPQAAYPQVSQWSLPDGAIARLGKGQVSTNDRAVAYSPDGSRFAVASTIGIWLYNANTYTEVALLAGHVLPVNAVAFSPDSAHLASGGDDGVIKIWDVKTRKETATLIGHLNEVLCLDFSHDSVLLASGDDDGVIKLWDVAAKMEVATISAHAEGVCSIGFSPDGAMLASVSEDWTVKLWDVATGEKIATLCGSACGHFGDVNSVAFSPEGFRLATASDDNIVKLWDVASHAETATLKHSSDVKSVVFFQNGNTLGCTVGKTVKLWDVTNQQEIATLEGHTSYVNALALSHDGAFLASASSDNTVKVWNMLTLQEDRTIEGYTLAVNSIDFSPGDSLLASADMGKKVRIWDMSDYSEERVISGTKNVSSLAFSPDGSTLVGGEDKTVKLWNTDVFGETASFIGHELTVNCVAFSTNGLLIASAGKDRTLLVWEVASFAKTATFCGHLADINSVAFTSDGENTILASASDDDTIRLWDVENRAEITVYEGHTSAVNAIAFFENGTLLASASDDDTIKTWNTETHREETTLFGHSKDVNSVVVSHDDMLLASGSDDHTVKVWNLSVIAESPPTICTLTGHTAAVNTVVFSSDASLLASASDDGTILLWDATVYSTLPLGDVSGDRSVSSYDAALILRYVVGLIDEFPASSMKSPGNIPPRNYKVSLSSPTTREGKSVNVYVKIDDAAGLTAGGMSIKFDPSLLRVVRVASFLNKAYSESNVKSDEVRFAFATTTPIQSGEYLLMIEFEALSNTEGKISPIIFDDVQLSNSKSITTINGSVTILPNQTKLLQNYPNPFNPDTFIPFVLSQPENATITICDISGKVVRVLHLGQLPAGSYINRLSAAHWNGRNQDGQFVSSGMYFYRLKAGDFQAVRRMLIVK